MLLGPILGHKNFTISSKWIVELYGLFRSNQADTFFPAFPHFGK